jgi:hypothetical protein
MSDIRQSWPGRPQPRRQRTIKPGLVLALGLCLMGVLYAFAGNLPAAVFAPASAPISLSGAASPAEPTAPPAGRPLSGSSRPTSPPAAIAGSLGSLLFTDQAGPPLIEQIRLATQPPIFPTPAVAPARGPQRLHFTVTANGQEHEHRIGLAYVGAADVPGAAGQWLVQPWTRPAWLPISDDCGAGMTIIAGHVAWQGQPGPFHDLGALTEGDEIVCQARTGRWHTYRVTRRARIEYHETQQYRQREPGGSKTLVLYSCTPEVDGILVVWSTQIEEEALHRQ